MADIAIDKMNYTFIKINNTQCSKRKGVPKLHKEAVSSLIIFVELFDKLHYIKGMSEN